MDVDNSLRRLHRGAVYKIELEKSGLDPWVGKMRYSKLRGFRWWFSHARWVDGEPIYVDLKVVNSKGDDLVGGLYDIPAAELARFCRMYLDEYDRFKQEVNDDSSGD